jgi:hypothetical protein
LALLYEVLGPFALPLAVFCEGTMGAKRRSLYGLNAGYLSQLTFFFMIWTFNILFIVFNKDILRDISILEVVMLNVAVLIRNVIIATKYAYSSNLELHRKRKQEESVSEETLDNQIITGWMAPSDNSLVRQLDLASLQSTVDLHQLRLRIGTPKDEVDICKNF